MWLVQAFLTPDDASWVRAGDAVSVALPRHARPRLRGFGHVAQPAGRGGEPVGGGDHPAGGGGGRDTRAERPRHGDHTGRTNRSSRFRSPPFEYEGETAVVFVRGEGPVVLGRDAPSKSPVSGDEEAIIGSGVDTGDILAVDAGLHAQGAGPLRGIRGGAVIPHPTGARRIDTRPPMRTDRDPVLNRILDWSLRQRVVALALVGAHGGRRGSPP